MKINKSLQYKIVQDQYRNPGTGLGTNGPLRKVARWQAHGFAESDVAPASVAEQAIIKQSEVRIMKEIVFGRSDFEIDSEL